MTSDLFLAHPWAPPPHFRPTWGAPPPLPPGTGRRTAQGSCARAGAVCRASRWFTPGEVAAQVPTWQHLQR